MCVLALGGEKEQRPWNSLPSRLLPEVDESLDNAYCVNDNAKRVAQRSAAFERAVAGPRQAPERRSLVGLVRRSQPKRTRWFPFLRCPFFFVTN